MDRERLKRDVERIEAHRKEKSEIAKSEREIFSALKADGFNCKIVREIIKRRSMEDSDGWDAEVATYEAAVQGLELAAGAVRDGATYDEAAKSHNVRKADLHHFVRATSAVPENDFPDHDADGVIAEKPTYVSPTQAYIDSFAAPKPEDGDDGITESCGAQQGGGVADSAPPVPRADATALPHDADMGIPISKDEAPATPSVGARGFLCPLCHRDPHDPDCEDAPVLPPSVGAVADASVSEGPRVAPNNPDDDDLAIPPFLIRAKRERAA